MWIRMLMASTTACVLAAFPGCERQDQSSAKGGPRGRSQESGVQELGAADRMFLSNAAQGNLAEIALGRMALEKGDQAEVKAFGQRMVEDHSRANHELVDLARKKGIELPADPDSDHRRAVARLSDQSGDAFDRKFVEMMVADHVTAVALFEDSSKNSQDPDVRAFAENTLPLLEGHLKMARDLGTKLGTSASSD